MFIKIRKQTQNDRIMKYYCRSEDERDAAIQRVEELQEALDGIQKKSKERSKKVIWTVIINFIVSVIFVPW